MILPRQNQWALPGLPPPVRAVLLFSWAGALLLCLAQALYPGQVEAYGLYSFVIGIVLLGLPHGALDHLVPGRMRFAWARKPAGVALYILAYAAVAGLYFGLWLVQPLLAFVGFLAATVFHWGQGDLRFLEIFLGRRRPSRWGAGVSVLLRGSLPIALPILAFPETAESFYRHMVKGLGLQAVPLELASPAVQAGLCLYMGLLFGLYLLNALRAAPGRAVLALDGLELILLTLLFVSVPAYMSVGIYFIAWHSVRHLARLVVLEPRRAERLRAGRWRAPVLRTALELIPVTLAAIAMLAGLYFWKAQHLTSLETFVALYMVLISALTKPHLILVALMDYAPKKESF